MSKASSTTIRAFTSSGLCPTTISFTIAPRRVRTRLTRGRIFGFGRLGIPFPDPLDASLRFVDIKGFQRFAVPVLARRGVWVETGTDASPQFQAAVRELSVYDYHRLLIAGGVTLGEVETLPTVDDLLDGLVSPLVAAPKDAFRTAAVIPDGTGYVWQGGAMPNLAESAALQERARADHQNVLRHISRRVEERGGSWFYNNNVDLYAKIGEQRLLVEAKSLANPARAVDRMRYGMGQLFDYRVRYEAELAGAQPVLTFGTPPERRDAWIANILDGNGVALIALVGGSLRPLEYTRRIARDPRLRAATDYRPCEPTWRSNG